MKLLFCTNAFERIINGPAKFSHLLLKINETTTHEIRILTEDTNFETDKIYKQILRIPRLLQFAGMFLRMFQYHYKARQIKKSYNFDYLVYNNAIIGIVSAIFYKKTVGFINDDNNASVSWRDGFLKFKWNKAHVFFITEWLSCKVFKKIIVNSDYLRTVLKNKYKIPESKIFRLYKSIELIPEKLNPLNSIPVILFVKNDYERGGLFILIDACNQLNRKIQLIVAGMPESAYSKIKEKCFSKNIDLEIAGIQPQEKIYELMRKADIFSVPSFKEALGVANIEAIALGCSIITSNTGGIPEVMENGKCGWLVEPGDIDALTTAILECLNNEKLREAKHQNALRSIKRFNLHTMINEFLNILQR